MKCATCGRDFAPARHYHKVCWECWRALNVDTADVVKGDFSVMLDDVIKLTHPDKHPPERFTDANRVTARLIAMRDVKRGT